MHLVLTQESDSLVRVKGAEGKLSDTIKSGIRPARQRIFDQSAGDWLVHWQWLGWVATIARGNGYTTDWSGLPDRWQMIAAGAKAKFERTSVSEDDPYRVLYVHSDAPTYIVKAAYRALVSKHHPDAGGDASEFHKIDSAYRQIQKLRSL